MVANNIDMSQTGYDTYNLAQSQNTNNYDIDTLCISIHNATAGKIGTDEKIISQILEQSDAFTLAKIMDRYSEVTGSEIYKDIENDFSDKEEKEILEKLNDAYKQTNNKDYDGYNDGKLNNKQIITSVWNGIKDKALSIGAIVGGTIAAPFIAGAAGSLMTGVFGAAAAATIAGFAAPVLALTGIVTAGYMIYKGVKQTSQAIQTAKNATTDDVSMSAVQSGTAGVISAAEGAYIGCQSAKGLVDSFKNIKTRAASKTVEEPVQKTDTNPFETTEATNPAETHAQTAESAENITSAETNAQTAESAENVATSEKTINPDIKTSETPANEPKSIQTVKNSETLNPAKTNTQTVKSTENVATSEKTINPDIKTSETFTHEAESAKPVSVNSESSTKPVADTPKVDGRKVSFTDKNGNTVECTVKIKTIPEKGIERIEILNPEGKVVGYSKYQIADGQEMALMYDGDSYLHVDLMENTSNGNIKGIGSELHKLNVLRSQELGLEGRVGFQSLQRAIGFHYKSGFRCPKDYLGAEANNKIIEEVLSTNSGRLEKIPGINYGISMCLPKENIPVVLSL